MINNLVLMDYSTWFGQFEPIMPPNPDPNDGYDGLLFNIHDEDHKATVDRSVGTNTVWTLTENDGIRSIVEGWHYVNREGYFITKNPYSGSDTYEITFGDQEDAEEFDDTFDEDIASYD